VDTSNWEGRSVLVTGAAGFIGSHLVEELYNRGASVRAMVRYTSRAEVGMLEHVPKDCREGVKIFYGDLRDPGAVREAVEGMDALFHLGAVISVPYSFIHPREVVEVNVMGTYNLLEAARDFKIPSIVQVSTSEVFGTAETEAIDETHRRHAQSPYAASKTGADELARSFHLTYDLPVVIVRPFNTFGPRQSQRAVISTVIVQALQGEVVRLGNLDSVRDFTYVKDTVSGLIRASEVEKAVGHDINLGTGTGITIGELSEMIFGIMGLERTVEVESERLRPWKSEVQYLVSDNTLARDVLGWKPEHTLSEGLGLTVNWIQDHLDLYRREIA
jgi:dTDP-glucose 4,6-dehydratase